MKPGGAGGETLRPRGAATRTYDRLSATNRTTLANLNTEPGEQKPRVVYGYSGGLLEVTDVIRRPSQS